MFKKLVMSPVFATCNTGLDRSLVDASTIQSTVL